MRKFFVVVFTLVFSSPILAMHTLDKVVAIINDDVITATELNTQVEQLRAQMQSKNVAMPSEGALRKQVLNHLINVNLQLQLAKKNDITVDSVELDQAIKKIADGNQLTVAQLREEIEKQGMTWQTYRENIRKEIMISHVQQKAVGKEVVISNQQVEDYLKVAKKTQQPSQNIYHLQNIVIPLPEAPTSEQLRKAEKKAALLLDKIHRGEDFGRMAIAESSDEYALEGGDLGERHLPELPDLFAKAVLNMKAGDVEGPLRAGNGLHLLKLVAVKGQGPQHHQLVKSHVRHILLKQDVNMTTEEAMRQANNLYQQLKAGKDFALMAKQYSLDAASAVKGGDLGWVTAEELVPTFAKAMTALPLNTISKPVKSPFGWHIIEVLERKTVDDSKMFERQQVRQFLHQRKFAEAVQNWQQHMRVDAYVKIIEKDLA